MSCYASQNISVIEYLLKQRDMLRHFFSKHRKLLPPYAPTHMPHTKELLLLRRCISITLALFIHRSIGVNGSVWEVCPCSTLPILAHFYRLNAVTGLSERDRLLKQSAAHKVLVLSCSLVSTTGCILLVSSLLNKAFTRQLHTHVES